MTLTTQLRVLLTLQTIFYRVSKNEIRTKSETRKTHKKVGFIGMVVLVGPSAEPQPLETPFYFATLCRMRLL